MTDLLLDALADALGIVVADLRREWRKEVEVISAESRALIGELRAEIATLTAQLKDRAGDEITRVVALAGSVKNGVDGRDGIDGLPGADGAPGAAGRDGIDGKAGPQGEPGRDGKDAPPVTPDQIAEQVIAYLTLNPPAAGKDGAPGVDGKDGLPGAPGRDGLDGKDGANGMNGRDGAPGLDGKDGSPGETGQNGQDGADGATGPAGRDGVGLSGAMINRAGELVLTLSDGTLCKLSRVVGADGKDGRDGADGQNGIDGKDGAPGFGFDDLTMEYDGERSFAIVFARGDKEKRFNFTTPTQLYRGVYEDGRLYQPGDTVTFGGAQWHCSKPTTGRPKADDAWKLAVKRGEPGKDGRDGFRAAPVLTIPPASDPKEGKE